MSARRLNSCAGYGNGTTTSTGGPVLVKLGRTKVAAIRASCDDSYALTRNGQVLAWGYDGEGQLGNGGAVNSATPLRVHLPSGWRASAVGSGPVTGVCVGERGDPT